MSDKKSSFQTIWPIVLRQVLTVAKTPPIWIPWE